MDSWFPRPAPGRGSVGGAQSVYRTGPLKDATISRNQLVAPERCRHDDAISRVAVEVRQLRGTDSDIAIDRDLGYPLVELLVPPHPYFLGEPEPSSFLQDRDLPERDRRDSHNVGVPRPINLDPRLCTKFRITRPQPQNHLCVEQEQSGSSRLPLVSASHSTSMGSPISPTISNRPRSIPNSVSGFVRYGTSRDTGRPCLVMTTSSPLLATSSMGMRHLALNSDALTVRPLRDQRLLPLLILPNTTIAMTIGAPRPSSSMLDTFEPWVCLREP